MEVGVCRGFSNDKEEQRSVLTVFKQTVSGFNSDFEDDDQRLGALFTIHRIASH